MATRMLPDAVQRLSDLNSISTPNMELEKACKSAISDQRARIELNKIKVIEYELWLIKWTLKRAKFLDLFKIYLKLRFVIIFNYYYKIRFSA